MKSFPKKTLLTLPTSSNAFATGLFDNSAGSPLWKYIPVPKDSGRISWLGTTVYFMDCYETKLISEQSWNSRDQSLVDTAISHLLILHKTSTAIFVSFVNQEKTDYHKLITGQQLGQIRSFVRRSSRWEVKRMWKIETCGLGVGSVWRYMLLLIIFPLPRMVRGDKKDLNILNFCSLAL